MSAESLSFIAGSVLSMLFSYWPGLNTKFAGLSSEVKRLIMLGLLVLVAAGVYGLGCSGFGAEFGIVVTCDRGGLVGLISSLAIAVIANQSVFAITPKTVAVREVLRDAAFEALAE